MRVLAAASEIYPLVKTGGLADVIGALPAAVKAEGIETRTVVPGYPGVLASLPDASEILRLSSLYGGPARVLGASLAGRQLFVVDAPHLYVRPGGLYGGPTGADWPDNALRFAALGRVTAQIARGAIPAFAPDVVHVHDWQAALALAFMHYEDCPHPGAILTIHNLAFQGRFPAAMLAEIGLPARAMTIEGVEFYGDISFLKAGIQFADRITTVSPTYALEIQRPGFGMGLDGLLRLRAGVLSGILNGIDVVVWNPADDPRIAATFTADRLAERGANKRALQRKTGLPLTPDTLLFGVISRLSSQKGLDLVLANLPWMAAAGMQFVLLGSGAVELQEGFAAAARAHPEQVAAVIGYDEDLAHLIQAGADALLVPSRFEPCGLTQLCAMRYGALPVVARVGGLADTIVDANEMAVASGVATGFQFGPVTADDLAMAIRRAAALFKNTSAWQTTQRNAMTTDVSWRTPARRYAGLYREVAGLRIGG